MIRGLWTPTTVGWFLLASAFPVVVALGLEQGVPGLARLGLCLVVVGLWQTAFRVSLAVGFAPASAIGALAVSVIAPTDVALLQVLLAVSFGAVMAELIFGGWGRNFLSAGIAALSFLSLSVPGAVFEPAGPGLALAVLPGAVMLILTGILPVALALAYIAVLGALVLIPGQWVLLSPALGTIAFVLVFLVADPVASATTTMGRTVQGGMSAALLGLLATGTSVPQAAIFAALLAALFAPLIDHGVITLKMQLKRSRRGQS